MKRFILWAVLAAVLIGCGDGEGSNTTLTPSEATATSDEVATATPSMMPSFNLTAKAVPEPTSIVALGLVSVGSLALLKRRK